ncbi:MAG: zf-HC2 domain-containing protein [Acidobacteriota bacterium]
MKALACSAVRARLSAFHDGELPVGEQVLVESHLRICRSCASEAAEFVSLGEAIRAAAVLPIGTDELSAFQEDVVSRLAAEYEASVPVQVGHWFDDMRLGVAALGSTAASFVSVMLVAGIFYFGPQSQRSDSLAGVMEVMSAARATTTVGTQLPSLPSAAVISREVFEDEDAVFALAAVVTRNGRVKNLEIVLSEQRTTAEQERVLRLLDQVSRARLEPAMMGGSPVAARTVWLLAHTTVRAKLPPKQSSVPRAAGRTALI